MSWRCIAQPALLSTCCSIAHDRQGVGKLATAMGLRMPPLADSTVPRGALLRFAASPPDRFCRCTVQVHYQGFVQGPTQQHSELKYTRGSKYIDLVSQRVASPTLPCSVGLPASALPCALLSGQWVLSVAIASAFITPAGDTAAKHCQELHLWAVFHLLSVSGLASRSGEHRSISASSSWRYMQVLVSMSVAMSVAMWFAFERLFETPRLTFAPFA